MELREAITTESWVEDIQFALGVFARNEPLRDSEQHIRDYLSRRYVHSVAAREWVVIRASYNWLVRNWDELGEVGLCTSENGERGFVNALLLALHNLVFREVNPEWWERVPDAPLRPVIQEAQAFIDAEKSRESNSGQPSPTRDESNDSI